jgi:PhzF family phenazine biosynthesis protein
VGTPLSHVDAFTDAPFAGNPAAVCILEDPTDDATWMQAVAAELNLSETAFVVSRADGDFDLRWFTPTVEVDLCGHATLASAHTLWETERLAPGAAARFHTRSGLLVAEQSNGSIEMDFPARPVQSAIVGGLETLGTPGLPLGTFDNGHQLIVELRDEAAVGTTAPDFAALGRAADRLWIVTAPASSTRDADFVSRCFGPRYGIDEDPVTGSAHCALAPFWADRFGRDTLVGHQISARGGRVSVQLRGDRVLLGGSAVTILRGELLT